MKEEPSMLDAVVCSACKGTGLVLPGPTITDHSGSRDGINHGATAALAWINRQDWQRQVEAIARARRNPYLRSTPTTPA